MVIERLIEVGPRISCTKMSFFGENRDIMLSKIVVWVSAVPLHLVSICTISSMGAGC